MQIAIEVVKSKKQLKDFIFLPEKIHHDDPRWIPPVYMDEWKFYDPNHNKSFALSETVLFLAYKGAESVGRVMGIINTPYNKLHNEKTARFFNLDCFQDAQVSHSLMQAVEDWALKKGMEKIIGPFGFSDKDPEGVQIEGFEYLPVIATATNLPFLRDLIEQEGYSKKIDCVVYKLVVPESIPESYQKVFDRVIQSKNVRLLEFTNRRQLKPYIIPVLRLVNDTYKSIFGFVPMEEEEMKQLAAKYLPMLDPEFTKLVTDDQNNPIACIIASPDISRGIQRAKGRIFPFGFIYILSAARSSKQLDLFLGAVKDPDKNRGVAALLGVKLFQSASRRGLQYIDSHLILETNKPMRAILERLGAKVYKRYRIYTKDLFPMSRT